MHLLIPAAGAGRRMGHDRNKLLLGLLGLPCIGWTLKAAAAARSVEGMGIICQPLDRPDFEAIVDRLGLDLPVDFIQGGDTRQEIGRAHV